MARDNGGNTPLHETAGCGSPDNIQALLDAGTNINARANDGRTPLLTATAFGPSQILRRFWTLVQMSWQGITVAEHHCTGLSPVTCHLPCQCGCELGQITSPAGR